MAHNIFALFIFDVCTSFTEQSKIKKKHFLSLGKNYHHKGGIIQHKIKSRITIAVSITVVVGGGNCKKEEEERMHIFSEFQSTTTTTLKG